MPPARLTTIARLLNQASLQLQQHDSARLDAEVLLAHVLEQPRSHLHAWPDKPVEAAQTAGFEQLVARRRAGEPVAYLTGQREFWSLDLKVTPDTLIPRPDTELLVEQALALLPASAPLQVADLGTGSGAVALALASERPHWQVYALDRSPACIEVTRHNARQLKLSPGLLVGHWSDCFRTHSLDAIVANPPYVRRGDQHLETGDVRFEPRSALVAGDDGLDDIRRLAGDAVRVLRPGGWLLLEHAPDQSSAVREILKACHFNAVYTARDLAGRERISCARSPV